MTSNEHESLPKYEGKRHLPQPMGPHSVGYLDFMTPGPSGVLARIYYPTLEQCLEHHDSWPLWMDTEVFEGSLDFINATLSRWPSWAPRKDYKFIDTIQYILPFIPKSFVSTLCKIYNVYVPIISTASISQDSKSLKPLMIFSHGLGCTRCSYSRICYDLASYGVIVAAIEHRDGSAGFTYSISNDTRVKIPIPFRKIEMEDDEYQVRNEQVHFRSKETIQLLNVMSSLNEGSLSLTSSLVPIKGLKDPLMFKNSMDLSKISLGGHSFGGATALLSLANEPRFNLAVILDGWLFPLSQENSLTSRVDKPMLFIDTESFMTEQNMSKKSEFLSETNLGYCIVGSVHQNHMDNPLVFRDTLLKKFIGCHSETCPELIISLNNKLMLQFLSQHLHLPKDEEILSDIKRHKDVLLCFKTQLRRFVSQCKCYFHK